MDPALTRTVAENHHSGEALAGQDLHYGRRERFAALIGDGIALIPAGAQMTRNNDVEYPFRQDSSFYYLTGFDEPDAVMLLDPSADGEQYVLFVRPRDREREIWDGRRAGTEGAKRRYSADASYPLSEFDGVLRRRLVGRPVVYLPFSNAGFHRRVLGTVRAVGGLAVRYGTPAPTEVRDTSPHLAELRLHKTPEEVARLRIACEITAEGHSEAMRFTRPGQYEYQVQAALEYIFRARGARRDGYPAIVASGGNACILHYTDNDRRIANGDLVLIDAGAEYEYFSADITRTFPSSGAFSGPQRAIYDVVLSAQRAAVELAKPGSTMKQLHQKAVETVAEGLIDIGLLPGTVDEAVRMHHYREFFMHGTGHWLGMDVHDAGAYGIEGRPRPLAPGMAFTVEPGVYVDPERSVIELSMFEHDLDAWMERRVLLGAEKAKDLEKRERAEAPTVRHRIPDAFRGIGVRIEDDVLITDAGHEVLTGGVPTSPEDVEALCAEASVAPFLAPTLGPKGDS